MELHRSPLKSQFVQRAFWILACLFFMAAILINLLPFLDGKNDLMDFGSFYAAGIKISSGDNPYDPNSPYIFEINFARVGAGGKMINLNPPISVMIFELLSTTDPYRSMMIWQVISVLLYIASIFLLAASYKQNITPIRFAWALTLAGFWHTIVLGQIYTALLLFTVLGWVLLKGHKHILAGIAIGLVIAIKPNFMIWALFLLVAGYYTAVLVSVIVSLILSLIPLLVHGSGIYTQWMEASALRLETLMMPGNDSILGLTARFHSVALGIIVSGVLVITLLVVSRLQASKNLADTEYSSALGIIASLLASPISWTGYSIMLLPIFFSLKKWTIPIVVAALLLVIPFQIVLQLFQTSFANFIIFGWLYGWGILFLLGALAKDTIANKSIRAG